MNFWGRKKVDWLLIAGVLLILLFSCLAVYSSTSNSQSVNMRENFNKQLVWIAIGLCLSAVVMLVPTRWLSRSR